MPEPPMARANRNRPRFLMPVIVIVSMIGLLLSVFAGLYTDLLWFRSTGYTNVLTDRLRTQAMLFLLFGLTMAALVLANVVIAYRIRPPFRAMSLEQQNLERYRAGIEPYLMPVLLTIGFAVTALAGTSAASRWRLWMLWRNGVPFGEKDAQFGMDIGFYAFTYPFLRFVLMFFFVGLVAALLAATLTHYLFGGLRLQTPGDKVTTGAQRHLAVLLGVLLLLKALAYWLDRYGLAFSERGRVTGPSFTDVNAVLPAKTILTFVAIICALLFFSALFLRGWLLPAGGLALMVLAAVLVGGVYPMLVQQFQVRPSEAEKEASFIKRNIEATAKAYGLDDVDYKDYTGTAPANASVTRTQGDTLSRVRVLDPNLLKPTYQQLQSFRAYYSFAEPLDIDRYTVDGEQQDQIVGVRELNQDGLTGGQDNWINRHLVYTHGYGFVSAPISQVDEDGQPVFSSRDIPQEASSPKEGNPLGVTQPRIYFGEQSPPYSIVGAPEGARPQELDYPSNRGGGQVNNTYDGEGGVSVGSQFNQLLYALQFREKNIFLSTGVTEASKILYIREPRDRVKKVAPWLTMDGDPYPAVIDGRIVWILDGYTTSDGYPYSERRVLSTLTQDSTVATSANVAALPQEQVNYIRNSVKATVDAYDGTVNLYEWDENDPVLKTWSKAFKGTVKPKSQISDDLMSHFRYPEDLFKVQRELLSSYHVQDPRAFYNGNDFWKVPGDPTNSSGGAGGDQPPYYLTLGLPGTGNPVFSLTSPLVASNRPNLTAFVQANSAPGDGYGKITVLQLPRSTQVNGPGQAANLFESNPTVASQLSLLRRGGSRVVLGNLLGLPVGGGLLYVQPVYVQATGNEASFPTLQKVILSYGNEVAFTNTLREGLEEIFGGAPPPTQTPPGTVTPPGTQPPPPTGSAALQAAITEANDAFEDGQAALRGGDFGAYGEAQRRLQAALARAAAAGGVEAPTGGGAGDAGDAAETLQ